MEVSMSQEWPENERLGEILYELQQLSIDIDWMKERIRNQENEIEGVPEVKNRVKRICDDRVENIIDA